jgi:alkylhydroperoxidase family enzyme
VSRSYTRLVSSEANRHADKIAALRRAILETPGIASLDQRAAAESAAPTGSADGYLDKVRRESYRIVDDDIDALRAAGLTEDAIFELTLAAALGEATRILDRSIGALAVVSAPPAAPSDAGEGA